METGPQGDPPLLRLTNLTPPNALTDYIVIERDVGQTYVVRFEEQEHTLLIDEGWKGNNILQYCTKQNSRPLSQETRDRIYPLGYRALMDRALVVRMAELKHAEKTQEPSRMAYLNSSTLRNPRNPQEQPTRTSAR